MGPAETGIAQASAPGRGNPLLAPPSWFRRPGAISWQPSRHVRPRASVPSAGRSAVAGFYRACERRAVSSSPCVGSEKVRFRKGGCFWSEGWGNERRSPQSVSTVYPGCSKPLWLTTQFPISGFLPGKLLGRPR